MRIVAPVDNERSLAIVAMGNSFRDYMYYNFDKDKDGNICDDIWVVNSAAFVLKADMAIMMDDLKDLEERRPNYARRIKELDIPVLTSRAYPEYPNVIQYPLDRVLSKYQFKYLNGSVAYGLAFALYMGYKKIMMYGCDYMYDHKPGLYERGRGCVEFWICAGTVIEGADIKIAGSSTLMDSNNPKFYGYRELPKFDIKPSKKDKTRMIINQIGWEPQKDPEEDMKKKKEFQAKMDGNKPAKNLIEKTEIGKQTIVTPITDGQQPKAEGSIG